MSALELARQAPDYSQEQVELIKRTIARGATDDELAMFMAQCRRTGLDPFTRQIYAIKRWDSDANREVMSTQTGIDGFRLIAERTGKYAGQQGPFWCGKDGRWVDVWLLDEPPLAAKVAVLRKDWTEPLWGVARFASYAQKKKDGKLSRMWALMPDLMIAKVAEALALRRAFPNELSGVYSVDELGQADNDASPTPAAAPPKKPRQARTPELPPASPALISDGQRRRLFTIAKKQNWVEADIKALILSFGFESSKDITVDKYDEIVAALETGEVVGEVES